jgi:hypothetical protein
MIHKINLLTPLLPFWTCENYSSQTIFKSVQLPQYCANFLTQKLKKCGITGQWIESLKNIFKSRATDLLESSRHLRSNIITADCHPHQWQKAVLILPFPMKMITNYSRLFQSIPDSVSIVKSCSFHNCTVTI